MGCDYEGEVFLLNPTNAVGGFVQAQPTTPGRTRPDFFHSLGGEIEKTWEARGLVLAL